MNARNVPFELVEVANQLDMYGLRQEADALTDIASYLIHGGAYMGQIGAGFEQNLAGDMNGSENMEGRQL